MGCTYSVLFFFQRAIWAAVFYVKNILLTPFLPRAPLYTAHARLRRPSLCARIYYVILKAYNRSITHSIMKKILCFNNKYMKLFSCQSVHIIKIHTSIYCLLGFLWRLPCSISGWKPYSPLSSDISTYS